MDLHKYPLDTQHCPLMIGSCELVMFIKRIFILTSLAHYRLSFIRVLALSAFCVAHPSFDRSSVSIKITRYILIAAFVVVI